MGPLSLLYCNFYELPLVGCYNPSEKYSSKFGIISSRFEVKKKSLKPPPMLIVPSWDSHYQDSTCIICRIFGCFFVDFWLLNLLTQASQEKTFHFWKEKKNLGLRGVRKICIFKWPSGRHRQNKETPNGFSRIITWVLRRDSPFPFT